MQIIRKLFCLIYISYSSLCLCQPIDIEFNNKVKEYTTDKRFLPASVLNLVIHPVVPSPQKHFGDIIGTPGILHKTNEIFEYYKKLDATSDRLTMQQMGTTEEGRPFFLAAIADEATIKKLHHYKNQLALLADPRKVNEADIEKIIGNSKPVYYINGGMHSTETGSPEMLMELAYRLITSDTEEIKSIRQNIIVLINPVSEPDGTDKMVDWYYRYTKGREKIDDGFPRSPPYWGKYVFHDNNRDGIQVSQEITKSIFKGFFEWHPTVMLDLHESVPLLYISTGTGPYNEYVDPITIAEWQIMANHDIASLTSQGLPGAFTWAFYDGWWPGYGIWIANNHNSNGRFYETFGNSGADTYLRDLSNAKYAGDAADSRQWYRPEPPTKHVYWSLRNNINYMQAGVIASLNYAARNVSPLLKNFYQKGLNSLRKGKEETPKAFIIHKNQHDPSMVSYLISQLQAQKIEVHEDADSYYIHCEQPYRNLVVSLLTRQQYPKDAKHPPYDGISWTLNLLYGVEVQIKDTIDFDVKNLNILTKPAKYIGKVVENNGSTYVINYSGQQNLLPALYKIVGSDDGAKLYSTSDSVTYNNQILFPGSIILQNIDNSLVNSIAKDFGIDILTSSVDPNKVNSKKISLPKIAIYHNWYNTQDEGWSRYTFEKLGIPYTSIDKDDLKTGNLNAWFDVILMPRTRGNAKTFIHGVDKKFGPMPYNKTENYPSHGFPDETNDMTGGPGFLGVSHLEQFVGNGGLIISFDNTSQILSDLGVVSDFSTADSDGLFHPGSIVQAKRRDNNSPVLFGFGEKFQLYRGNGPLLQINKDDRYKMLVQYGTTPLKDEIPYTGPVMGQPDKNIKNGKKDTKLDNAPYVLSGMVRNEEKIIGHGAVFHTKAGKGGVLLFTFDPLHRFLNHHDGIMVWNALLHWDKLTNE